jgi:RimJ/RimL family protein N-acetyltransferase
VIVTDERVARFVGERCGAVVAAPYTCMGIERDGKIIAGVLFNYYTVHDIAVTVAGERFSRSFIQAVGKYVFEQVGCLRMSIMTEQPKVIKIAKRLGAQTEGIKRNYFGKGRDGIMLGILREDWSY